MANKIVSNLDFGKNEIQNAVLQNLSTPPSNPKVGQTYFDTVDNIDKVWTGTDWIARNTGGADTNTTYTFAEGTINGAFDVTPSNSTVQSILVHGLNNAAYKDVDTEVTSGSVSTNIPTTAAVATYVANTMSAISGMDYKGTVGIGGDVADLPTTDVKKGDLYVVYANDTYASQAAIVGDMFIASSTTPTWSYVPSGNDVGVNRYEAANTELTVAGGCCTWTVTHNLGKKYCNVAIYEIATGEEVMADVIATSTSQTTIIIASDTNIAADTYRIVCIG